MIWRKNKPQEQSVDKSLWKKNISKLVDYLNDVPAVTTHSHEITDDMFWWVKLSIDTDHPLAWRVVQELGHVLNYLSISEKLPTVFMPVSPPPYLNGGVEFLSWVIESRVNDIDPGYIAKTLHGRLPRPVTDAKLWEIDE